MRVLVIGGAGYIGSHVCKELKKAGHTAIVVDNLSTGHRESVEDFEFHECDITNREALGCVFHDVEPDAVIHMAAKIVVSDSVKYPNNYYHNNVTGMINVLKWCAFFNVKHFVFSSTAAVYQPSEMRITEDDPLIPMNPYGRSKLMCESMMADLARSESWFNATSLRYFNVAGAEADGSIGQSFPTSTHLIKIAVEAAAGKRDGVQIYGEDYATVDGTAVRDYVHVSDLAHAHVLALEEQINSSHQILKAYNVGTGEGYSVKQILNTVRQVTGVDFPVEIAPRRQGDPAVLVADSRKIQLELHWQPLRSNLVNLINTAYSWELNKRY